MKLRFPVAILSPHGRSDAHFYNIARLSFVRETEWVIEYFSRRRPSSPKPGSKVGKRGHIFLSTCTERFGGPEPRL